MPIFALKKRNPQSTALTAPLEKEPYGGNYFSSFLQSFSFEKNSLKLSNIKHIANIFCSMLSFIIKAKYEPRNTPISPPDTVKITFFVSISLSL